MTALTETFEMNGRTYQTDAETLAVLRRIAPAALNDASAVAALMHLGLARGRIVLREPVTADEPICPKCGLVNSDAWEWADDQEVECGYGCGCTFIARRHVAVSYTTVTKGWTSRCTWIARNEAP